MAAHNVVDYQVQFEEMQAALHGIQYYLSNTKLSGETLAAGFLSISDGQLQYSFVPPTQSQEHEGLPDLVFPMAAVSDLRINNRRHGIRLKVHLKAFIEWADQNEFSCEFEEGKESIVTLESTFGKPDEYQSFVDEVYPQLRYLCATSSAGSAWTTNSTVAGAALALNAEVHIHHPHHHHDGSQQPIEGPTVGEEEEGEGIMEEEEEEEQQDEEQVVYDDELMGEEEEEENQTGRSLEEEYDSFPETPREEEGGGLPLDTQDGESMMNISGVSPAFFNTLESVVECEEEEEEGAAASTTLQLSNGSQLHYEGDEGEDGATPAALPTQELTPSQILQEGPLEDPLGIQHQEENLCDLEEVEEARPPSKAAKVKGGTKKESKKAKAAAAAKAKKDAAKRSANDSINSNSKKNSTSTATTAKKGRGGKKKSSTPPPAESEIDTEGEKKEEQTAVDGATSIQQTAATCEEEEGDLVLEGISPISKNHCTPGVSPSGGLHLETTGDALYSPAHLEAVRRTMEMDTPPPDEEELHLLHMAEQGVGFNGAPVRIAYNTNAVPPPLPTVLSPPVFERKKSPFFQMEDEEEDAVPKLVVRRKAVDLNLSGDASLVVAPAFPQIAVPTPPVPSNSRGRGGGGSRGPVAAKATIASSAKAKKVDQKVMEKLGDEALGKRGGSKKVTAALQAAAEEREEEEDDEGDISLSDFLRGKTTLSNKKPPKASTAACTTRSAPPRSRSNSTGRVCDVLADFNFGDPKMTHGKKLVDGGPLQGGSSSARKNAAKATASASQSGKAKSGGRSVAAKALLIQGVNTTMARQEDLDSAEGKEQHQGNNMKAGVEEEDPTTPHGTTAISTTNTSGKCTHLGSSGSSGGANNKVKVVTFVHTASDATAGGGDSVSRTGSIMRRSKQSEGGLQETARSTTTGDVRGRSTTPLHQFTGSTQGGLDPQHLASVIATPALGSSGKKKLLGAPPPAATVAITTGRAGTKHKPKQQRSSLLKAHAAVEVQSSQEEGSDIDDATAAGSGSGLLERGMTLGEAVQLGDEGLLARLVDEGQRAIERGRAQRREREEYEHEKQAAREVYTCVGRVMDACFQESKRRRFEVNQAVSTKLAAVQAEINAAKNVVLGRQEEVADLLKRKHDQVAEQMRRKHEEVNELTRRKLEDVSQQTKRKLDNLDDLMLSTTTFLKNQFQDVATLEGRDAETAMNVISAKLHIQDSPRHSTSPHGRK